MSHPNPKFDRSLLKGVPTLALKEELSVRKQCAQVARDAFFKEKWPFRTWILVPTLFCTFLLMCLTKYVWQPHIIERFGFVYDLPVGLLLGVIVLIPPLLPSFFVLQKEKQEEHEENG